MKRLVVNTPARLHFGLIDMNGELGRIDGGIGLALESPHTQIEVEKAEDVRVECKIEPEIVDRLYHAVTSICEHYNLPGAHVKILERPLAHLGLGSATQTLVGAAKAVCELYGVNKEIREISRLAGRGGTSGIGIAAIQSGGLLLDSGHRFRRGENCKHGYSPSAASVGIEPPFVISRLEFPDWDILVTAPLGEGASGLREVEIFKVVCPIPLQDVQKMCHIIIMQMFPAVVEKDLEMFGTAIESFQTFGFKVFELRAQTDLLRNCMKFLKDNGGIGVGMSSWGPALFTFGEDLSELKMKIDDWLSENGGGETVLTKANNNGMTIIETQE